MGRYEFLGEIAKGPFGALYELHTEVGKSGLSALGRVVPLPDDLSLEGEQTIGEAVSASLELRHDFVLRMADVLFGKGWITLIHDYSEGSVVRSLQRRAHDRHLVFPVGVALRIVLDVLEGLELSRSVIESVGIARSAGGAGASSLYLCGDGRTRSLDGQLTATLMRTEQTRDHVTVIGFPAPELVDPQQHPDERTDVFAAGALLWELLTAHELALGSAVVRARRPRPRVPNVSLSIPKGTQIPRSLAQAVNAALELDPAKRPATKSELKSAVTSGVEVATYEKVIEFTDSLLQRESTLFRLTLTPKPRLSDELHGAGVKPAEFGRAVGLGKRARSKIPRPPPRPSFGLPPRRPIPIEDQPVEVEPEPTSEPVVNPLEPIPVPALDLLASPPAAPDPLPVPSHAPIATASTLVETLRRVAPWKSVSSHLFHLKLPTLIIGFVVTIAVAVMVTVIIQGGSSKDPAFPSPSTAIVARPQLAAAPIPTPVPPAPAPTPTFVETVPLPSPPAAPVTEVPSTGKASPNRKPVTATIKRAATPSSPSASKQTARKRVPKYVPSDL